MKMRLFLFILFSFVGFLHAQHTKFFRTYSVGVFDVGEVVIPINDTNYVVAGTTNTNGLNGTDALLFQTNSVGDVVWWKNYGNNGTQSAKGAVMAVDNSGYFLAGYQNKFDSTGYDIWLIKTNLTGDTLFTKTYGGADWEIAHSINKFSDSTYIIAGETYSFGNGQRDMYLLHIGANGDTLWTKTFGGAQDDIAKYAFVDRYDNVLVVGSTESMGAGNSDVYLIYLDMNGDTLWTKLVGTTEDDFGYSADMYIDTSNTMGFVIGYTSYYTPDLAQNSYILRIDSLGNSIGLFPQMEVPAEILDHIKIRRSDPGKVFFTADLKYGYNQISIIYSAKTVTGLILEVQQTYGSGGNESTNPNDIYRTLDGGYIITGYSENWGPGPTSCFLLKTDTILAAPNTPEIGIENVGEITLNVFPNPVQGNYFYINSSEQIEGVKIYHLTGQLIKTYTIGNSVQSVTLEKPFISDGIYIIEIQTENGVICKKIFF